jgi:hypothetical protein
MHRIGIVVTKLFDDCSDFVVIAMSKTFADCLLEAGSIGKVHISRCVFGEGRKWGVLKENIPRRKLTLEHPASVGHRACRLSFSELKGPWLNSSRVEQNTGYG